MKMVFACIILLISASSFGVTPAVSGGEVKILYPCSSLSNMDVEKEESETITFFEKGQRGLNDVGLILRHREASQGHEDLTVKFRDPKDQEINLDETIYRDFSRSHAGEFKCEADVNYDPLHPQSTVSCSWTMEGKDLEKEHFDFIKMVGVETPDLSNLRDVQVRSTSWKLVIDDGKLATGPIKKRPSVEKWQFRNECLLEVSGKFEAKTTDPERVYAKAKEALKFLKGLVKATPSPLQGNKTSRALGI